MYKGEFFVAIRKRLKVVLDIQITINYIFKKQNSQIYTSDQVL